MSKPRYIYEAELLLGEQELRGDAHNPRIVELYKDAGHPDVDADEVAWCAAFVGSALHRAGYKRTGSLVAQSYRHYGTKLKGPRLYCIGVMRYKRSSWQGHVGFVVKYDRDHVWLLGGNQNNRVSVQKYPRRGGTYEFVAFVMPVKRLSKSELANKSRKIRSINATQTVTALTTAGGVASWQFLEKTKAFLTDNTSYILLGIAAFIVVSTWVYKRFIFEDYAQDRYTPSGEVDASAPVVHEGEADEDLAAKEIE